MARPDEPWRLTEGGRPAYHEADEGWSGRRVVLTFGGKPTDCGEARIRITVPFWRDEVERVAYERAVSEIRPWAHFSAPRDFDPEDKRSPGAGGAWMGMERLCQEIVSLAAGLDSRRRAVPDMPETRMSRRERDAALMKLRGQADGLPSGTEDLA